MKIASLRWAPYRVPFCTPYVTSRGASTQREGLLLQVVTDDGRTGLGEAAPVPELCLTVEGLGRAVSEMAPRLLRFVGADPRAVDTRRLGDGGGARSAITCAFDTACCDVMARESGLPMSLALSKGAAQSVDVNALVTAGSTADAVEAGKEARKAGYRTVKLKVGTQQDTRAEQARIRQVRVALGPEVSLRLDPNGAWDFETAVAVLGGLEDASIEYVEDPLPMDPTVGLGERIQALARLQRAIPMPIACDEEVTDREVAQRLLETGAARVLIVKPQRVGGIRLALGIIETARLSGAQAVVTTSIETGVGTAACLHLSATMGRGAPACGLATASLLACELSEPSIPVTAGLMQVPVTPGLGVQLSPAGERYLGPWQALA